MMDTPKKPTFSFKTTSFNAKPSQHKTPAPRAQSCVSRLALSEYQARAASCKFNSLHTSVKHVNNNNIVNTEKHKLLESFAARLGLPQPPRTVVKPKTTNNLTHDSIHTKYTHSHHEILNTVAKSQTKKNSQLQAEVEGKIYKVLRKIGTGGSAKVYECFEPSGEQVVALKVINVGNADPRTRLSIFNEQTLLRQLQDCEHVVRVFASEYKSNIGELLIVMEKGDADLAQVLNMRTKIDGLFIRTCWYGMLQAVSEIHKKGVVHADLKPVNFILVRGTIKLIDFGIANFVAPDETSLIRDYQIGTINYMAPETLKNDPRHNERRVLTTLENTEMKSKNIVRYGAKADIWSLGCILYNFVYGRPPFDKQQDMFAKLQAITDPNHTIDFPPINNQDLLNTMKSCLQYDPLDRPSTEDLLNHPFLSRVLDV